MPIYDYRCNSCNKRASLFFRSFSAIGNAVCPSCGSTDMKRIISAPTVLKSAETRAAHTDDILRSGEFDMYDKNRIANWTREVGDRLGGDAREDLLEKVERMESGEFVPELTDARYYADYVAEEQRKDILGQSADSTGGDEGSSGSGGSDSGA